MKELRFPPIKCGDLGSQVSDAIVDSFGRIVLHEMLSVVHPPIPTPRLNGGSRTRGTQVDTACPVLVGEPIYLDYFGQDQISSHGTHRIMFTQQHITSNYPS
jgi:hypothetical protein